MFYICIHQCLYFEKKSFKLTVHRDKSDVAEIAMPQRLWIWINGSVVADSWVQRWTGSASVGWEKLVLYFKIAHVYLYRFFFFFFWCRHVLLYGFEKQQALLCSGTNGSERICGPLYLIQAFVHVNQCGSAVGRLLLRIWMTVPSELVK